MTLPVQSSSELPFEEHFRQFALFFGGAVDQQQTLRYLLALAPRDSDRAASGHRSRSTLSAKARRDLLESLQWQSATIRAPFQSWIADKMGDPAGMLVLTERLFSRRETRGDGIAQHFSSWDESVVSGQLGIFLSYVTPRGRAVIDARLLAPGQSGSDSSGLSRPALGIGMIDGARERLPAALVVAGRGFGDDEGFREALRARELPFVVAISESCPVFWSPSASQRAASRRRAPSRARDLTRGSIGQVLQSVPTDGDVGPGTPGRAFAPRPIWDSLGSSVSAPAWTIKLPPNNGSTADFYLIHSDASPPESVLREASEALKHPTDELSAPPGESIFDRYDSVRADAWQRHMTLAMLASAWSTDSASAVDGGPSTSNGWLKGLPRTTSIQPLPVAVKPRLANPQRRSRISALSIFLTLAALSFALIVGAMIATARSLPFLGQRDLIRVSSFYHPPEDGTSIGSMVARTRQVIFTRGDERYLQQMRDLGFQGPALQYLVANEVSGPARATSASAACGEYLQTGNDVTGIAGDFCSALHRDERNFIHNGKGERLFSELSYQEGNTRRTRYYYLMNPASPAWREYLAERAAENVSALPYGGLFLDNIDLTPRRAADNEKNSDGKVAEYAGDRVYRDAVVGYLDTLRARLPTTPIWANLTEGDNLAEDYLPYLPYLDGVMNEYFVAQDEGRVVGPNGWAAQMAQADSVINQGKSFLAVAQGSRNDTNRMRFALTSYLMIAGPNTYFRYANGERYQEAWQYDDYENRLGSPLGPRYQDGGQWRREFSCGSVSVDVERRAADISIRNNQPTCLAERAVLRVPFFSGLIAQH